MKIEAIAGRGARKDFVDLRVLCRDGVEVDAAFELFERKYGTRRVCRSRALRRIGLLLERQGMEERLLAKLEGALEPSSATIPWIPSLPKRGRVNRRWGVVNNEPG